MSDSALLAFLHLSEKAAAERFATLYGEMLDDDPETRAVFGDVLRSEVFPLTYTRTQLTRVAPERNRQGGTSTARAGQLWRAYLRFAGALAGLLGGIVLTVQYFLFLPWFAIAAKRAARREAGGWQARPAGDQGALESQCGCASWGSRRTTTTRRRRSSIDGVPVAAVEEERLSRRKNDAAFPLAAIAWCLESAGRRARRPRRGGVAKSRCSVRAHPHHGSARLPALAAGLRPRDAKRAG